ncbi:MAG: M28 family peptidase [Clostridiales bacterium]|nr:M28 family peptidase [Clostridiales bacterium]
MKRVLLFTLIALLVVLSFGSAVAFAQIPTFASAVNSSVNVNSAELKQFVQELCELNGQGDKMATAIYLLGKFDEALANASGVTTSVQEQYFGDGKSYSNIVAKIAKAGISKQLIIGAHYDAVGQGAGDNAVGVAALYCTMKALAANANKIPFNVTFVAFDGEEDGLLGSDYFVNGRNGSGGMSAEEKANTLVMFNIDSIALGQNMYLMCENKHTTLANTILTHAQGVQEKPYAKGIYGSHMDSFNYGYYEFVQGSDHTSFRLAGIPIAFFFSGEYKRGSWNFDPGSRVNTAADTYENLEGSQFVERIITVSNAIVDTVLDEQFPTVATNARKELVNIKLWYNGWWPSLVVLGILIILAVFTFLYYRKLQKNSILGTAEIKTQKVFEKPDASEIFSFADSNEKSDVDDIFTFKN